MSVETALVIGTVFGLFVGVGIGGVLLTPWHAPRRPNARKRCDRVNTICLACHHDIANAEPELHNIACPKRGTPHA